MNVTWNGGGEKEKEKRGGGGGDYKGYRYPTSPTPQLTTYPLPYFFHAFISLPPPQTMASSLLEKQQNNCSQEEGKKVIEVPFSNLCGLRRESVSYSQSPLKANQSARWLSW